MDSVAAAKLTEIAWTRIDGIGLEHLKLEESKESITADSQLLLCDHDAMVRATYVIRCDAQWRVNEVELTCSRQCFHLRRDADNRWRDPAGKCLKELEGCTDVDISATPFTNTLPIRRLQLQPGQSSEIRVVFIEAPSLRAKVVQQRYTFLGASADGFSYRYENLDGGI